MYKVDLPLLVADEESAIYEPSADLEMSVLMEPSGLSLSDYKNVLDVFRYLEDDLGKVVFFQSERLADESGNRIVIRARLVDVLRELDYPKPIGAKIHYLIRAANERRLEELKKYYVAQKDEKSVVAIVKALSFDDALAVFYDEVATVAESDFDHNCLTMNTVSEETAAELIDVGVPSNAKN